MVKIEREQRSKMKNRGRQEKAKMGSQKGVGVKNKKFKKGIASFYIVTFTTLILTIMTASFAVVMVSEVTRTANDELSQSAYDAALAGIEDAKIAYANYQRCETAIRTDTVTNGTTEYESCDAIINAVKDAENTTNCDLVGQLTGRLKDGATGEVVLNESGDNNGMNQAYTCVTIKTSLSDYRSTLSSQQQVRVIRGIFDDAEASAIKSIRLSWATNKAGAPSNFSLHNKSGDKIVFNSSNNGQNVAQPPMLEVQILQTAPNFTVNQILQETTGGATDRATLYLVPMPTENSGANYLNAVQVAKTNDRTIKNEPFAINCNTSTEEEFACSVDIALPEPINAGTGDNIRNGDTFAIMIALPYGQPDTDVSVQFCNREKCEVTSDGTSISDTSVVMLKNLQVEIDSTGRANDLYRRVKTRLEPADTAFSYPYYALQLLGDGGSELLAKKMTVLCENQLYDLDRNGNGNNGQGEIGGKITGSSRNSSDGCGEGAKSFTRKAPNPIEDNSSNIEWVEPTIVEPGIKEDGSEYVPQYSKPWFWP